jgi:D-3-phosphoglycerate dehydrogenase / 2-oxoglutarate reductase
MDRAFHKRVVVISESEFGDGSIEDEILGDLAEVRFVGARNSEELIQSAADADGLLVQYAPITATVIDSLRNLRVIVRYGSGVDKIDVAHARKRDVEVHNVPDYCIDEVADHAAAAIHAASRRLLLYGMAVKAGNWPPIDIPPPLPPAEDPVGIVGYGRNGSAVASRLKQAGHPVYVFDEYAARTATRDGYACFPSLMELAGRVNHLSLHVPLSIETRGMVGAEVLNRLGSSAHVVNTARGQLINESDLLQWLEASPHRVATLDVLSKEPPIAGLSQLLAQHPRALVTPHVAYLSTASLPRLRRTAALLVREALRLDHGD